MTESGAEPQYELQTRRLTLRALSLEETRLAMGDVRGALGEGIGAQVPEGWPGPDLIEALPSIVVEMERQVGDERWLWVIIERETAMLIGDIGFHGPLANTATVELGYVILPSHQGRGYATEAARAMLKWAATRPGVERVIVRIAPENTPSLRVAAKLRMRETPSLEPRYRRFEWLTHHRRR